MVRARAVYIVFHAMFCGMSGSVACISTGHYRLCIRASRCAIAPRTSIQAVLCIAFLFGGLGAD